MTPEDGAVSRRAHLAEPGVAPLTVRERVEIGEDTHTTVTADFAPIRRGRTDEYVLQPVSEGITVSDEGVDDG